MKVIFLATFLLVISGAEAISNEYEDFNMNFTSEGGIIIQSNEQAHELFVIGNLDGNGNIEVSTRLNHKVVLMEHNNEHKHELSVTVRKGGGGRGGGGGGGGGGRGGGFVRGRGAGAAAGVIVGGTTAGVVGGESFNHGAHHSNNSATSLYAGPYFCFSFILCVSFWL